MADAEASSADESARVREEAHRVVEAIKEKARHAVLRMKGELQEERELRGRLSEELEAARSGLGPTGDAGEEVGRAGAAALEERLRQHEEELAQTREAHHQQIAEFKEKAKIAVQRAREQGEARMRAELEEQIAVSKEEAASSEGASTQAALAQEAASLREEVGEFHSKLATSEAQGEALEDARRSIASLQERQQEGLDAKAAIAQELEQARTQLEAEVKSALVQQAASSEAASSAVEALQEELAQMRSATSESGANGQELEIARHTIAELKEQCKAGSEATETLVQELQQARAEKSPERESGWGEDLAIPEAMSAEVEALREELEQARRATEQDKQQVQHLSDELQEATASNTERQQLLAAEASRAKEVVSQELEQVRPELAAERELVVSNGSGWGEDIVLPETSAAEVEALQGELAQAGQAAELNKQQMQHLMDELQEATASSVKQQEFLIAEASRAQEVVSQELEQVRAELAAERELALNNQSGWGEDVALPDTSAAEVAALKEELAQAGHVAEQSKQQMQHLMDELQEATALSAKQQELLAAEASSAQEVVSQELEQVRAELAAQREVVVSNGSGWGEDIALPDTSAAEVETLKEELAQAGRSAEQSKQQLQHLTDELHESTASSAKQQDMLVAEASRAQEVSQELEQVRSELAAERELVLSKESGWGEDIVLPDTTSADIEALQEELSQASRTAEQSEQQMKHLTDELQEATASSARQQEMLAAEASRAQEFASQELEQARADLAAERQLASNNEAASFDVLQERLRQQAEELDMQSKQQTQHLMDELQEATASSAKQQELLVAAASRAQAAASQELEHALAELAAERQLALSNVSGWGEDIALPETTPAEVEALKEELAQAEQRKQQMQHLMDEMQESIASSVQQQELLAAEASRAQEVVSQELEQVREELAAAREVVVSNGSGWGEDIALPEAKSAEVEALQEELAQAGRSAEHNKQQLQHLTDALQEATAASAKQQELLAAEASRAQEVLSQKLEQARAELAAERELALSKESGWGDDIVLPDTTSAEVEGLQVELAQAGRAAEQSKQQMQHLMDQLREATTSSSDQELLAAEASRTREAVSHELEQVRAELAAAQELALSKESGWGEEIALPQSTLAEVEALKEELAQSGRAEEQSKRQLQRLMDEFKEATSASSEQQELLVAEASRAQEVASRELEQARAELAAERELALSKESGWGEDIAVPDATSAEVEALKEELAEADRASEQSKSRLQYLMDELQEATVASSEKYELLVAEASQAQEVGSQELEQVRTELSSERELALSNEAASFDVLQERLRRQAEELEAQSKQQMQHLMDELQEATASGSNQVEVLSTESSQAQHALRSEYEESKGMLGEVRQDLEDTRSRIAESEERQVEVVQQVEQFQQGVEGLRGAHMQALQEARSLRERLDESEEASDALRENLRHTEEEFAEARSDFGEKKAALQEKARDMFMRAREQAEERSRQISDELEQERAAAAALRVEHLADVQKAEGAAAGQDASRQKLEESLTKLKQELKQTQDRFRKTDRELDEVRSECNELLGTMGPPSAGAGRGAAAADPQRAVLEGRLMSLQHELDFARLDHQAAQTKNEELEAELSKAVAERTALAEELECARASSSSPPPPPPPPPPPVDSEELCSLKKALEASRQEAQGELARAQERHAAELSRVRADCEAELEGLRRQLSVATQNVDVAAQARSIGGAEGCEVQQPPPPQPPPPPPPPPPPDVKRDTKDGGEAAALRTELLEQRCRELQEQLTAARQRGASASGGGGEFPSGTGQASPSSSSSPKPADRGLGGGSSGLQRRQAAFEPWLRDKAAPLAERLRLQPGWEQTVGDVFYIVDDGLRDFTARLLRRGPFLWTFYVHLLVLYAIVALCLTSTTGSDPLVVLGSGGAGSSGGLRFRQGEDVGGGGPALRGQGGADGGKDEAP